MAIETNFRFAHEVIAPQLDELAAIDLRGRLAGLVNNAPMGNSVRRWTGTGFNLIWRPNFSGLSGPKDFFLELNLTDESLDFTDVTGMSGVANRGLLQPDIFLGAIAYVQQINDAFDNTGQHFEPGFWNNIPATDHPTEPTAVTRMGSIPHGTSIQLQGVSFTAPTPVIAPASITPFAIGSPDDGQTGLIHFPEEILANQTDSRTPLVRLPGLTQQFLTNPNLFLSNVIAGQNITSTTVLIVASDPSLLPPATPPVPPHPAIGGGISNIPFLRGDSAGPNANVPAVTATFWIETVRNPDGTEFLQLQYTQRVLLTFNGLNWPHISVATLR